MKRGHLVLTGFLAPMGYDARAWRLPESRSEEIGKLGFLVDMARAYERAKLDAVFVADTVTSRPLLSGNLSDSNLYEPITALSALAASTDRIGLIGTVSTTYNHPFTVARQLASLDVLSGGRAGWNLVTSGWGEENYGMTLPPKEDRYRRAGEFYEVVKALWSAWSDDAVINDRAAGRWVDPARIREVHHEGEFFKVDGFCGEMRSPQGHPVIVQAGMSTSGRNLGAGIAELVYAAHPHLDSAKEYYAAYKANVAAYGRRPEDSKILPGIVPYIGKTEAEARELMDSLVQFVDFEDVRMKLSQQFQLKLDDLDLDERIPPERFAGKDDDNSGTRFMAYKRLAVEKGYTLRELLINKSSIGGHLMVCGTASQVADTMIEWFEEHACDGFNLNPPAVPASISQICDLLVPELQNRGYFRSEYTSSTLRGHVGLPIPPAWDRADEGR